MPQLDCAMCLISCLANVNVDGREGLMTLLRKYGGIMDILQHLPIEKWRALRDSLKRDWPAYAYYYNYVKNSIKWKTTDPSIKIEFYCPDAKADAGVFISNSDHGRRSLILFSFVESKDLLREILRKTNRINWSETFNCACVHENIQDVLREFLDEEGESKGLRSYTYHDNYCYLKSREDCLKLEVEIPEECELKRIDETYAPLIHSIWPHRDIQNPERTLEFLTTIAKLNGGYGLFLKNDDTLVSWIMQCNLGGLGMLQTLEEHKRKSYGKTVTRAQMKYLAEKEDVDMTLFIIQPNVESRKFFESMGFERVASPVWFHINP